MLALDRTVMPSDILSTHGLVRGGVVQLSRWGLLDRLVADGAPPVRTVSISGPDGRVDPPVKDSAGVDFLLAPRRTRIDALLVEEPPPLVPRYVWGSRSTGSDATATVELSASRHVSAAGNRPCCAPVTWWRPTH